MSETHRHTLPHLLRIACYESWLEFLKCLRIPAFSVSLFVFPVGMFLFFGLGMKWEPAHIQHTLYWATASSCMGVIGVGLFGFGVYVATERGQGWLLLKRVSPMPPLMYFLAKTMMSILFSCIVVAVILSIALSSGQVVTNVETVLKLIGILVLTTVPFCTLGLAIAYLVGPNSAHAVINVVYLPQLFLGGIVVPYEYLPTYLQTIASVLPSYHSVQLAFGVIDSASHPSWLWNVLVLSCYTLLFGALATYRYYKDEGRTYG